ncbi:MAG TPA: type II toxin-antitoxin system RelB/DinJ family antitoxin [Burkholderiaceae bacterium]|nr:type II toxin-antitoxin system RelB/DinJ family antitoxin [Burkholderiaceae bacterium]
MTTVSVRIDEQLKSEAYNALEELGVKPADYIRQALQYVATENKLPFYPVLLSEEDKELLDVVKKRLANPQKGIKVKLNEL